MTITIVAPSPDVRRLGRWAAAAGDLLLGACCAGCGRPWWGACPDCRSLLSARPPQPTRPEPPPAGFPATVTAGPYDEVARGVITAHKEDQALQLTSLLGRLLAVSVGELGRLAGLDRSDPLVLVPMPSAPAAVRRRGFAATDALARSAARRLRSDYDRVRVIDALVQRRGRRDQSELGAAERQENLRGGLRLSRHPIRRLGMDAYVIVVDDLVTTGASLAEAARVLRAGRLPLLGAATVAATRRWTASADL